MNPNDWIIVPNWARFQHYKDRQPRWIKLYTEVMTRDEMLELTDAEFGLLVRIWASYALAGGRIKYRTLTERGRNRGRTRAFKRLCDAGLIQLSASPEKRRELNKSLNQEPVEALVFEAPIEGGLGEQLVSQFRQAVEGRNGRA